jgi:hypothetical protein
MCHLLHICTICYTSWFSDSIQRTSALEFGLRCCTRYILVHVGNTTGDNCDTGAIRRGRMEFVHAATPGGATQTNEGGQVTVKATWQGSASA